MVIGFLSQKRMRKTIDNAFRKKYRINSAVHSNREENKRIKSRIKTAQNRRNKNKLCMENNFLH